MEIKPFVEVATKEYTDISTHKTKDGYSISIQLQQGIVECTTQRKKVRIWKNLDVIAEGLRNKGYEGQLVVRITQQGRLNV